MNGLLLLCLRHIPTPEQRPANVWRAILGEKSGYAPARRQQQGRQLKAVRAIVASHSDELAELGVTP